MLLHLCGTLIGPQGRTLTLVGSDRANDMWAPTGKSKDVCQIMLIWALGAILDSKLFSFKWQEAVSDILSASTQSDPSTTRE
ncbi:hypothetical protein O181_062583 [Austropuccinia psidii MF-1]|uniref:Uncharacterized protein n=1 Tax=Austropuccinia psidii MF-1 TaxID=1389203 RepID=A0A9Q3EQ06_9BASI|nr:hypothetical protein [Austropuccinia psidii MF-1]